MTTMEMIIDGTFGGQPVADYYRSGGYVSYGGYEFICKIKDRELNIPFDWASTCTLVNDDETITVQNGVFALFDGDYEIDDCFDDEYAKLGINREDITAEVLAGTSSIFEFYYDYEPVMDGDKIKILSIKLSDGENDLFVSQDVIDAFNMSEV